MNVDVRIDGRAVEIPGHGTDPGLQAACIATAVDLGPRPRPAVRGLLLLDSDEPRIEDVAAVGADWVAAVDALVRAPRRRWQLVVAGGVAGLDIVDAGQAGLWSVSRTPDGTAWRPIASEELWSALLSALVALAIAQASRRLGGYCPALPSGLQQQSQCVDSRVKPAPR